jgi:signal transduction histidine kinase/CheY-like chemotaxis protein
MSEALGVADGSATTCKILAGLAKEGRWSGELTLRCKDGGERHCESVVVPMRDSDGQLLAHVVMHRDITERKRMQERLLLAERLSSIGTLAAGVAHEVNNPLAFICANLSFLAERLPTLVHPGAERDEVREVIEEARVGAHRIRDIVADLKGMARERADASETILRVPDAIDFALKMVDHELRHRARLVKDYRGDCFVRASPSRLGQVLINLLVNAAQAIPEGNVRDHEIRVSCVRTGDQVVLEVRDTGEGIPADALGRIFDPFYTTKPVGVGTGLGLPVSHGIVTALGGELSVQSTPGKGTCFRVVLPAQPAPGEPARAAPAPREERRATVLVVDDEPIMLAVIRRLLGSDHEVVGVSAGQEALACIEAGRRFDVILSDMMMPQMTGMDLYARVRALVPEQAERMVFMTGGVFTARAEAFLQSVPNPMLTKPVDPAELRTLVGTAVQARRLGGRGVVEIPPVS